MQASISTRGFLRAKKIGPKMAPLSWRLRNKLRWSFLWGWTVAWLAKGFSWLTGAVTITTELRGRLRHEGQWTDYGVLSRRVVTNAGVGFLVDAWQNLVGIDAMNFHGCGTGGAAEAVGNTALTTESTTALNPDSTRATGVLSEPATNQLKSTGTVTFDASAAITEHGIFSQAATGGGTLWDRSLFAAINVVSGDSIQFEYTVTFTAGG